MNILFVTFTSAPGGATKAVAGLMRGLADKGHMIYVVTPSAGSLTEALKDTQVKVLYAPASLTVWPTYVEGNIVAKAKWMACRLLQWARCRRLIYRYIREFHIDIVHTNNGPVDLAPAACRKAGIPHVWHLREYQDRDFALRFFPSAHGFQKKIHRSGNFNIAITRGIFEHFLLRENTDQVIYDGVETCPPTVRMPDKEDIVLFAGNISEGKGLHSLIAGFAEFHETHPGYRLQVAGRFDENSEYCRKCRKAVENLGIDGNTEWLGYRDDILELMGRAKIFCVPSRFEGFGLITAEAMSQGCIVVGRDTAGTKEQMDNALQWTSAEAAIRFSDDAELAGCLSKAAEGDLSEMRERARQAAAHYSVQRNVDAVEDFYGQILTSWK